MANSNFSNLNIFPDPIQNISRQSKEQLLNQNGKIFWFTGLSGSGKTTIAKAFEKELHKKGYLTVLLDGDNIRHGINKDLDFSMESRTENIRRIAEISKLFCSSGIICLNCFVSPTQEIRQLAKDIIGENDFIEVFVDTPLEICEERDTKGLYEKARKGEIKDFTGISAAFEKTYKP